MSSPPFLTRNAADNLIVAQCRHTALGFPIIHASKSLMHRLPSFLGHISDVNARGFASTDG